MLKQNTGGMHDLHFEPKRRIDAKVSYGPVRQGRQDYNNRGEFGTGNGECIVRFHVEIL